MKYQPRQLVLILVALGYAADSSASGLHLVDGESILRYLGMLAVLAVLSAKRSGTPLAKYVTFAAALVALPVSLIIIAGISFAWFGSDSSLSRLQLGQVNLVLLYGLPPAAWFVAHRAFRRREQSPNRPMYPTQTAAEPAVRADESWRYVAGKRPYSDKEVAVMLSRKKNTSHLLHLVLSIVTFGVWVLVWIPIAISNSLENSRIDREILNGKKI